MNFINYWLDIRNNWSLSVCFCCCEVDGAWAWLWLGGWGSSSCLSAEDCSLIIDHQNVFTCQTSKTSKSSGRHPLCECLPSFTPSTHRDFILKWHTPAAGSETSHYLWNLSRKKALYMDTFKIKGNLPRCWIVFVQQETGRAECHVSPRPPSVIFDSGSVSGGFLFWWHLVAASVVFNWTRNPAGSYQEKKQTCFWFFRTFNSSWNSLSGFIWSDTIKWLHKVQFEYIIVAYQNKGPCIRHLFCLPAGLGFFCFCFFFAVEAKLDLRFSSWISEWTLIWRRAPL